MTDDRRLLAGRYLVGEVLGHGGMSDVHKGTDTRLGRTVAIKLLKPSLATDPAFRSRFRQEAHAASRMAHPTIVRVFDAGEETITGADGLEVQLPFIVMEYVEGTVLRDLIAQGPLEAEEAVRITAGILTALEYSHRAGVVHRDIKPANVMITRNGQVKVMDFGIARAISETASSMAQTTAIMGTASYFSPEQAKGEQLDNRTDLYSTGVLLFEMLTGKPPFAGGTPVAVAYQHVSERPPAPSSLNPHVSPAIDAVVAHALVKDRDKRYQTASEFRAELEQAGAGHVPAGRTPHDDFTETLFGPPTGVTATPTAVLRQITDDDTVAHVQRRPPVIWIWAGIAVVVVVVLSVLFWFFQLTPSGELPSTSRRVPAVAGMTYEKAVATLKRHQIKAERVDETSDKVDADRVISVVPGKGTIITKGETVTVHVSSGTKTIAVPDVSTMSIEDAQKALTDAGFTPGEVDKQDSPSILKDIVMKSDPAAGKQEHKGDVIDLIVSSGTVYLPDVTGQSLDDATTLLTGDDLDLDVQPQPDYNCQAENPSTVSNQSEPPGEVDQHSTITLTYCAG